MTWWRSVMLTTTFQVTDLKGGATDEAFQEQCFLWERGVSVGVDFEISRPFKCMRLYIKHRRKGKQLKKITVGLP